MSIAMKVLAAISILLAAASSAAEPVAQQETSVTAPHPSVFHDYLNPAAGEGGFLSIPGLSFHSSVGFSYSSSRGYGDVGMGYYMGHFSYRLGNTVTLDWNVGVGSYMMGDGMNGYRVLFPDMSLTWRPSGNVMVRVEYMQRGYLNPYLSRHPFGF